MSTTVNTVKRKRRDLSRFVVIKSGPPIDGHEPALKSFLCPSQSCEHEALLPFVEKLHERLPIS